MEKADSRHEDRVMKIASCLELPNKGLGRRKMLLGLVALKMEVGW